ncbi:MAG TPA: ANTAR domain-containing protein, partial [Xanthobacteraceae bacterium]|nr:ANTAR domain-containing protein [Xanthobacteraceae bacterium]
MIDPSKPKVKIESAAGDHKSIIQELNGLTVVVVAPLDDQIAFLVRDLQRLRTRARQTWPMPETIPGDADIVYCEYAPDLARRLPWIPGDARSALVVILPNGDPIQVEALA